MENTKKEVLAGVKVGDTLVCYARCYFDMSKIKKINKSYVLLENGKKVRIKDGYQIKSNTNGYYFGAKYWEIASKDDLKK